MAINIAISEFIEIVLLNYISRNIWGCGGSVVVVVVATTYPIRLSLCIFRNDL